MSRSLRLPGECPQFYERVMQPNFRYFSLNIGTVIPPFLADFFIDSLEICTRASQDINLQAHRVLDQSDRKSLSNKHIIIG